MIKGYLSGPVDIIHIESLQSLEGASLQAWICPTCGYVELHVAQPEDLARKDISDEEIEAFEE